MEIPHGVHGFTRPLFDPSDEVTEDDMKTVRRIVALFPANAVPPVFSPFTADKKASYMLMATYKKIPKLNSKVIFTVNFTDICGRLTTKTNLPAPLYSPQGNGRASGR